MRERLPDALGMVAQPPANHVLARGPGQVVFHVLRDPPSGPVGERADPRWGPGELRDERVTDAERRGQVPDQRLEERRARAPGRPLDDRPKGRHLIVVQVRAAIRPGSGSPPGAAGRHDPDDPRLACGDSTGPSITAILPIRVRNGRHRHRYRHRSRNGRPGPIDRSSTDSLAGATRERPHPGSFPPRNSPRTNIGERPSNTRRDSLAACPIFPWRISPGSAVRRHLCRLTETGPIGRGSFRPISAWC